MRLIALATLLFGTVALAGTTSVAVMPFRDLSGSKSPVGEAIRESVTSDLRGVPGLRVVERTEIDRVLKEQALQEKEMDQDTLSTVRIGKLIGADLMTVGAFQKAGRRVRITARFVKVETGEIVGTAKVDGEEAEFLELQDLVTLELCKSAKLGKQVVDRFARRSRPRLRSFKSVEYYGRAASEPDEPKKRVLLREAVREDPALAPAKDALETLERKLAEYERRLAAERTARLDAAKKRYEESTSPLERYAALYPYAELLRSQRRHNEALEVWRKAVAEAARVKDASLTQQLPGLRVQYIQQLQLLGRRGEVIKEGERFLAEHPNSAQFPQLQGILQREIDHQKAVEEGRAKAAKESAALSGDERWNLCRHAQIYLTHRQHTEARRLFIACLETDTGDPELAYPALIRLFVEAQDYATARKYLAVFESEFPEAHAQVRASLEHSVPIDG